ncbi:hypothetical protein V6N13_121120 [Hibiscus sabdariffa]|uniref:RNA polymerase II subunit A C-terminal domain phosphatase SSU72 n=1 Tax=Hibiscus sabdariffa TaxID=183260 RepID=A0ABR2E683_9ROSI
MKFRYAMVCSSDQNRSMEAHSLLKKQGFHVSSYGTGTHVKLPGPSLRQPNVYDFGTPYKLMFHDLRRKDPDLYKRNGILPRLKRNLSVKLAPQRWQDNAADGYFDIVFTFEEKVFDMVLEGEYTPEARDKLLAVEVNLIPMDLSSKHCSPFIIYPNLHNRDQVLLKSVLVINLEVKDNHEEAAVGAHLAFDLCEQIEAVDSWEDSIDDILISSENKHRRKLMYSISFY